PYHPLLPCVNLVFGESPAGEVARAHVQHIAVSDQPPERRPEFFEADAEVNMVNLVEVDPVSLQPLQRIGSMAAHLVAGNAASLIRTPRAGHVSIHFGRQHGLVAASVALLEPPPD